MLQYILHERSDTMTNRDYDKPLEFDLAIGKQKPNTVRRHEKYYPFCDVPHLKGILDKKGDLA